VFVVRYAAKCLDYCDHMDYSVVLDACRVDSDIYAAGPPAGLSLIAAKESFPAKLHTMLSSVERSGHSSVVHWLPHGRAFKIYDAERFESESKFSSPLRILS
jgi:hypothetical protein